MRKTTFLMITVFLLAIVTATLASASPPQTLQVNNAAICSSVVDVQMATAPRAEQGTSVQLRDSQTKTLVVSKIDQTAPTALQAIAVAGKTSKLTQTTLFATLNGCGPRCAARLLQTSVVAYSAPKPKAAPMASSPITAVARSGSITGPMAQNCIDMTCTYTTRAPEAVARRGEITQVSITNAFA